MDQLVFLPAVNTAIELLYSDNGHWKKTLIAVVESWQQVKFYFKNILSARYFL